MQVYNPSSQAWCEITTRSKKTRFSSSQLIPIFTSIVFQSVKMYCCVRSVVWALFSDYQPSPVFLAHEKFCHGFCFCLVFMFCLRPRLHVPATWFFPWSFAFKCLIRGGRCRGRGKKVFKELCNTVYTLKVSLVTSRIIPITFRDRRAIPLVISNFSHITRIICIFVVVICLIICVFCVKFA